MGPETPLDDDAVRARATVDAPEPAATRAGNAVVARTRGQEMFRRFLIAHMVAYVPALLWTAAWLPSLIKANVAALDAGPELSDAEIKSFFLKKMIAPALAAFLVPHALSIVWVVAKGTAGRRLFALGTILFTLAGLAYAGIAWADLLHA